jgi:uncharacterized protein (DUF924 family)
VRTRFEGDLRVAGSGANDGWAQEPRSALALIILCDQLPRNIHRGDPRAFVFDDHARRVAEGLVDAGLDAELWPIERVFAYMPFEHAEDAASQARSVALLERLRDAVPAEQRAQFQTFLEYAESHRDVIERFGRFPHRNAILGRTDTDAEREWLASGAQSWGQKR